MIRITPAHPGHFVWADLAATNAASAISFYSRMFGWTPIQYNVGGGAITRLCLDNLTFASIYQLRSRHDAAGVPSHWTPYIAVQDADAATAQVADLGGRPIVRPFDVDGIARVALVQDPVGALVGIWQQLRPPLIM